MVRIIICPDFGHLYCLITIVSEMVRFFLCRNVQFDVEFHKVGVNSKNLGYKNK